MYAILFTILFPVGIPLLFLLILYYFKVPRLARQKKKMNELRAVLIEIGIWKSVYGRFEHWDWDDEPVNLLTGSECSLILRNDFRFDAYQLSIYFPRDLFRRSHSLSLCCTGTVVFGRLEHGV